MDLENASRSDLIAAVRAGLALADELEGRYLPMSSAAGQAWDIAAEIRAALAAPLGQHDDGETT